MEKLKYDITHNTHISGNWGWILWYLPLVVIALMWAWRQFMKPCPQCDSKQTEIPK
jgi:hypothetical protein